MAILPDADRGDHRDHAGRRDHVDNAAVHRFRFANIAEIDDPFDITVGVTFGTAELGRLNETAVLAGNADRVATSLFDPADQFLVDRTG